MPQTFLMHIIDDAEHARFMLETALGDDCQIASFADAEACLAALDGGARVPQLVLADVGLPGIDGYALCRSLHARAGLATLPVIFISARDDLESALLGYDAGGVDFVVKPYKMAELKQKIAVVRRNGEAIARLSKSVNQWKSDSSELLSTLEEHATLVQFLRALNSCANYRNVIDATMTMLTSFSLNGVVQVRLPDLELTVGRNGDNHALEIAVVKHLRDMQRIVAFQKRAAYNFPHVTILINDMPIDQAELVGRLRDYLALAAAAADAKLVSLHAHSDSEQQLAMVRELGGLMDSAMDGYRARVVGARRGGLRAIDNLVHELREGCAGMDLTEQQEEQLTALVRAGAQEVAAGFDTGNDFEASFREVGKKLAALLERRAARPDSQEAEAGSHVQAIELF